MNILLLGATGKCGRWVHKLAHQRNHTITAIARPQSVHKLAAPATTIEAKSLTEDLIRGATQSQDAIISTLGLNRASIIPWSKLQSPPDLVQTVMASLVKPRTQSETPPKIIWLSAAGAGPSREHASWLVRKMTTLGNVGIAYKDLAAAETIVAPFADQIITVRPATLTNFNTSKPAKPLRRYKLTSTIPRRAVAQWMLDAAESDAPAGNQPLMIHG